MSIEEQIKQLALEELNTPSWGSTEQYLQIYELYRLDGIPQIARLDVDNGNKAIIFSYQGS